MAIEHAMVLVATRKAPAAGETARALGLRKATFLAMRGQAVKWLQRGVDEAVAAYQFGREPLAPASRHDQPMRKK